MRFAISTSLQAKKIGNNLKKHGHDVTYNLLMERLDECDAAAILRDQDLSAASFEDIMGYVKLTRSLWPVYPLHIQSKLCEATALRSLRKLAAIMAAQPGLPLEKWSEDTRDEFQVFMQSLNLAATSQLVTDNASFDGNDISFGNALFLHLHLIEGKDQAEKDSDNLEELWDIDEIIPEKADIDADAKMDKKMSQQTRLLKADLEEPYQFLLKQSV